MGEVIPFRRNTIGHASGNGDDGRWCSSCGTKRDTSPTCHVCGATAWQSYPLAVTSGTAAFSANLSATMVNATWLLT